MNLLRFGDSTPDTIYNMPTNAAFPKKYDLTRSKKNKKDGEILMSGRE